MAAFNGNDPPHRGPTFLLEFFDTRDFSKKQVLGSPKTFDLHHLPRGSRLEIELKSGINFVFR